MGGRFGHLFNWVLLIAGIAGVIYPAFFDDHLSLTQIIVSLFDPKPTLSFAMRWLSVIALVCAAYILITNWAYRHLPISVIWTNLDVYFDEEDGSCVRIDREQALRANQPGVSAYFGSCRATTEKGRVPGDQIAGSMYSDICRFQDRIELHGSDTRGYEVTHDFGMALPYSWYMPLIPVSLLNREHERIPKWLKKNIPVRRLSITYLNEFNAPKPTMSFSGSNYQRHNMMIRIRRPSRKLPNLRVRRIKTNGVVDVPWREQENNTLIFIDSFKSETVRITWG